MVVGRWEKLVLTRGKGEERGNEKKDGREEGGV